MRIDHYALRVKSRAYAVKHWQKLGFKRLQDFTIQLPTGIARSTALAGGDFDVFISSGKGLKEWVDKYGDSIHHVAYTTVNIEETVRRWKKAGIQFQTEIIVCPCAKPMKQVFTVEKFGVCHELIERNGHPGFCKHNVHRLMRGKA
jgi:4-hydroxyphenylpyruvate dioxygenase-like putative hemolysin